MRALGAGDRRLCGGILMPPLGLHCAAPGGGAGPAGASDVGRLLDGLRRAVECGVTFLDTADSYGLGRAERLIGRFLRERPDGSLRLGSKVGRVRGTAPHPFAGRRVRHQFEQSLENLHAEQLDLYTLDSFDFGRGDRYLGNAIDAMRALQAVGAVKAIGLRGPGADCAASVEERRAEAERFLYLFGLIRPDVVWVRFHACTPALLLGGEDLLSFTARHGVGLVLAEAPRHRRFTGTSAADPVSWRPFLPGGRRPAAWAAGEIGVGLRMLRDHFGDAPGTLARLALRACVQRGGNCVVLVSLDAETPVEHSYGGLGTALTEPELAVIDAVYSHIRAGLGGDAGRGLVEGMAR